MAAANDDAATAKRTAAFGCEGGDHRCWRCPHAMIVVVGGVVVGIVAADDDAAD